MDPGINQDGFTSNINSGIPSSIFHLSITKCRRGPWRHSSSWKAVRASELLTFPVFISFPTQTTKHFCFFTCQLYFFTSFPSVLPLQVTEQSYPRGINHLLFLFLKKECLSSEWEWSRDTYCFRYWIFSLNLTLRNPLLYSWFYSTMQLPQTQTSLSAGTLACLQELRLSALKLWHTVTWILPGLREPCIFSKANSYIWLALDFSSCILFDLVLAIKPFLSFTFFQRLPPQFLIPN